MADEEEAVELQMAMCELPNIRGHSFFVITRGRSRGVTEAPQVWCDNEVLLRQKRDQMSPFVRCLWNAVEKDQRITFASGEIMKSYLVEIGKLVLNGAHRGTSHLPILRLDPFR